MPRYDELSVGDPIGETEYVITRADLAAYAEASTDDNPIHLDDEAARALGLPGVVAHGMYTMGLGARMVAAWAGDPAAVVDYTVRFAKPVVVPEGAGATVVVSGAIRKKLDDGLVELNLTVTCGGEKVLSPARAVVRVG